VKYTKIFRSSLLFVGLAAPLFFALPSRAQQEVDPDHFEIQAAQSAPVVRAALVPKPRQIAAARARRPAAARTSANTLVAFVADHSTSLQLAGQSRSKPRATSSRKASAQNRVRRATKVASVVASE
jgi:hypothetical protein